MAIYRICGVNNILKDGDQFACGKPISAAIAPPSSVQTVRIFRGCLRCAISRAFRPIDSRGGVGGDSGQPLMRVASQDNVHTGPSHGWPLAVHVKPLCDSHENQIKPPARRPLRRPFPTLRRLNECRKPDYLHSAAIRQRRDVGEGLVSLINAATFRAAASTPMYSRELARFHRRIPRSKTVADQGKRGRANPTQNNLPSHGFRAKGPLPNGPCHALSMPSLLHPLNPHPDLS